jgi:predicted permease
MRLSLSSADPSPRLHRWLLALYPKSFRNEYAAEMQRIFRRRLREAAGPLPAAGIWIEEAADILPNALRAHFDILRQDLRYSWRSLRRTPSFFAAAVIVTALGIGATTAAFTLTDHILLRPLPYPDAGRLVKIWESNPNRNPGLRGLGGTNDVAPANFLDWKMLSTSFEEMGAYAFVSSNLVGRGDAERLSGVDIVPAALRAVGVQPAEGRLLDDAEDAEGAPCTLLISHEFKRRKFGDDARVVGEKLVLDEEPCTIAGVMPQGFVFPTRDIRFWRAARFSANTYGQRNNNYLRVVARLKPAVSVAQASADLARISAQLEKQYPAENKSVSTAVVTLRDEISQGTRTMIYAVAAASGCLLLIACTNVASLFLARATARSRELAVRTALGAGSERLVRQLLTDTVVIAVAGSALGVLIAVGAVPLAVKLVPTSLPIGEAPAADWRMLLVAAAGSLLTVVTCGVAPAIRATRLASAGALRDGVRSGTSRRTERVRSFLVTAQVAASVALLVCTGLLLRALWRVEAIDPGFRTDNVVTMRVNLAWPTYALNATRVALYRRVLDEVAVVPNVDQVAFVSALPLTLRGGVWPVYYPGQSPIPGKQAQSCLVRTITPRYFDVMGIPLIGGRTFDDRDTLKGELVAMVSQKFADKMWPGQSPIGRRFAMLQIERTIVGVVGEVRIRGIERTNEAQVYLPATQHPDNVWSNYASRDLAVKTTRELSGREMGALTTSLRAIVARADPNVPISDVRPLAEIVQSDFAFRSVQASVLRAFAIVAVVLASVGLHGLLAFMVSARTREIGVRIALGAPRRDILSMVLVRGLKLACIGGAIGLAAGYLTGLSFRSLLAGVEPADAAALAGAITIAVAMTLVGSFWPALRAARTDPITATRAD